MNNIWNNIPVNGSSAFWLCQKLKVVKNALKDWNKTHFGRVQVIIQESRELLELFQSKDPTYDILVEIKKRLSRIWMKLEKGRNLMQTKILNSIAQGR